jgi:hypothetical protein
MYPNPISVAYRSCLDPSPRIYRSQNNRLGAETKKLEMRVLSPAFFSRFIHYIHTSEAFDRESIFTDERNRTILISPLISLALLLSSSEEAAMRQNRTNWLDCIRWDIHKRLRCAPAKPTYSETARKAEDIRPKNSSSLDRFVRDSCEDAWVYRRQCIRLFLAQRFFFGFAGLVDVCDILFRMFLVVFAVRLTLSNEGSGLEPTRGCTLFEIAIPLLVNGVNVWECIKGR